MKYVALVGILIAIGLWIILTLAKLGYAGQVIETSLTCEIAHWNNETCEPPPNPCHIEATTDGDEAHVFCDVEVIRYDREANQ